MSQVTQFDTDRMFAPAAVVEAFLRQALNERSLPGNLREAALYSLLGPGKRLRPILIVRCCEAVGGSLEQAVPAAGAIEMIHCFSLIHDDLPAMDDDDLRRGRPTLHKHTNEAMAILAGDLLNTLAFETLVTHYGEQPDVAAALERELAIGTDDMIAGQVYDTLPDFDDGLDDLEKLRTIHRHKTGALLRAACRMGAICGGARPRGDDAQLQALTSYGEAIGLMFQVIDDLLDVTATTEQLGKRTGKDEDKGKLTYPGLLGVEASRSHVKDLHDQALEALAPLGAKAEDLRALCRFMAVRTK